MPFQPPFVGSIDQGTSSTRFFIFDSHGHVVSFHQMELSSENPHPGWCQQDPHHYLDNTLACMQEAVKKAKEDHGITISQENLSGIGITNQRETTVAWDKVTGKPLSPAIVWMDTRTRHIVADLVEQLGSKDAFRERCGLPISTYFSAMKMMWLLSHVVEVKTAVAEGRCLFGTVDSWMIWNLTGGVDGGVHVTDVTNASRTMLLNLSKLEWDAETCSRLNIPIETLPKVLSSAEVYGVLKTGLLDGVPIAGCVGDQQAALLGQFCTEPGDAKNTYGTGCFMLYNTGSAVIQSTHGLLTTVGYQLGSNASPVYALEGSIAIAGEAIKWLRDRMGLIQSAAEVTTLADSVKDTGGVYFVPAFAGLYAPYWRDDARGVIVGLTQFSTKAHLARATLEAVCYQTKELVGAMEKDSGVVIRRLKVDGGMTASTALVQIQADVLNIPVVVPEFKETTALGAAAAAGLATGVWSSIHAFKELVEGRSKTYLSVISEDVRAKRLRGWATAVERSFALAGEPEDEDE
eukprot:TRINITY_DN3444_c0_g1_i1.p1 TRINITY_DN3444_c0_g1~~TRINITY_DN3444_c0_g1_i1.p1  ORF type:complete len:519 (+),score=113.71 TRINITY_DN3444_c0_g1_i1:86-1642(+)